MDDTTVEDRTLECADGDADDEGECTIGPSDQTCTVASGHPQRICTTNSQCGGAPGSCASAPRKCFLTGGGTFQFAGQNDGTDTLIANGSEDAFIGGTAHPTLGAAFCLGPVSSSAVNSVAGLPGPGRALLKSNVRWLP